MSVSEWLRGLLRGSDPPQEPCAASEIPNRCNSSVKPDISNGTVIINGVELPPGVIDQLRALGLPLTFYPTFQLQEAVLAYEFDGVIVEDEEGLTFEDKLHLTAEEREKRAESKSQPACTITAIHPIGWVNLVPNFLDRILSERALDCGTLLPDHHGALA